MTAERYDELKEGGDSAASERNAESPQTAGLREELVAMTQDQSNAGSTERGVGNRLKVFEGLSEARSEQLGSESTYRFLVTAAVQASPAELGTWLGGSGEGFRASDRPVNTSLIDQDHNATFEGRNGFIITPPSDGAEVVMATAHDVGSNGMDAQEITMDADQLLAETSPTGYNQINIKSGKLAGVFIRKALDGRELGESVANQELREFAASHNLPIVEMLVKPQDLNSGAISMHELPASKGNQLWKISLPEDGRLGQVDIVRFQPSERPRGFNVDPNGFDLRILDIDPYGTTTNAMDDASRLSEVSARLVTLLGQVSQADRPALDFAIGRVQTRMTELTQGQS